ncbi:MAG: glycosyltransferase family 2 protein [Synergistaceae bacterium]|nr:glycosyltransferase family 2 protein [Synergistaceae bacterium]
MYIEKLSLYVIAMNEEERLPRTLESAKNLVDEIVVVDSGSTDRTEEIAKSYGARFIFHEWESVGHQVKFAEEQCEYDWVLRLDADEVIPEALAEEISSIRLNGGKDGYILPIGEVYPGMRHANRWVKHYKQIRLYNRRAWTMSGLVGHDAVVKAKDNATKGKCRNLIDHYSFMSLHKAVDKYNLESDRLASRSVEQGKNYSAWRLLGCSTLEFLKFYVLDRFFLLGWWGFIHSVNVSYLRFLKFAKFYEHEQFNQRDNPGL